MKKFLQIMCASQKVGKYIPGITKFEIKHVLKISAVYLDKQKKIFS
jgi:hypothetical protein